MADERPDMARLVFEAAPSDWNLRPLSIAQEVRGLLEAIADKGTAVDVICTHGQATLWMMVEGREYRLTLRPTRRR